MALTVEDGTGKTDAESYVSVADATSFLDARGDTAFGLATTAAKEQALRLATQYLDSVYGARWLGTRILREMSLMWPRTGVTDYDGFSLDSDAVPTVIKRATALLASRKIGGDTLLPDITAGTGPVTSTKTKVGPLETSKTFSSSSSYKVYSEVTTLVRNVTTDWLEVERA